MNQQSTAPGQMSSGVRRRLFTGAGATALSPVITALVQVVSVPILLHFWGARLYGEWLIVSAIPSYLALSDMGFSTVAGNEMTMRVGARDYAGAIETFQSTWALVSAISLILLALSVAILALPQSILALPTGGSGPLEVRLVLLLLAIYALITLQSLLSYAGFRSDGNFALGSLLLNLTRLFENLALLVAVFLGGKLLAAAAMLVIVRAACTLVMARMMLTRMPWLRFGIAHARRGTVKRLLSPALAFMAFPSAMAISLQGIVLIIGAVLGATAVAAFSAMRTLSRTGLLINDAVRSTFWPELSTAYGAEDWALARKLYHRAWQAAMALSLLTAAALLLLGERVFNLWTHHALAFSHLTFDLLVLAMLFSALWNISSIVTLAGNRHESIASVCLITTIVCVASAIYFTRIAGMSAAAATIVVGELFIAQYVFRLSLRWFSESLREFTAAVLDFSFLTSRISSARRASSAPVVLAAKASHRGEN